MFVYLALLKFCFYFIEMGKRNCFFNPNFQRIAKQLQNNNKVVVGKDRQEKKVSSNHMWWVHLFYFSGDRYNLIVLFWIMHPTRYLDALSKREDTYFVMHLWNNTHPTDTPGIGEISSYIDSYSKCLFVFQNFGADFVSGFSSSSSPCLFSLSSLPKAIQLNAKW